MKSPKQKSIDQNPIRFTTALPPGVKLDEIDWQASHFEELALRLRSWKKRWEQEDHDRRCRRAKQIRKEIFDDYKRLRAKGLLPPRETE